MGERVLIRETEWSREFRVEPGVFRLESKFARDGVEVTALDILERWQGWKPADQLDFATAFILKPLLNSEDHLILRFLMHHAGEPVWSTITHLLPRYQDREEAVSFLLERAAAEGPFEAAYYQALERIGDRRAVPVLESRYAALRDALSPLDRHGLHGKLSAFQQCCRALWKLTGNSVYRKSLEELLSHPDEAIRRRSELFLGS